MKLKADIVVRVVRVGMFVSVSVSEPGSLGDNLHTVSGGLLIEKLLTEYNSTEYLLLCFVHCS